LSTANQLS